MTARELINGLLGCDMDKEVVLEDDIAFTDDRDIELSGSYYQIESVKNHGQAALRFDNRHHFARKKEPLTVTEFADKCRECGKFKGESWNATLDKIEADIKRDTLRYTLARETFSMGHVEWSDRLIGENAVLGIIEKYRIRSNDKPEYNEWELFADNESKGTIKEKDPTTLDFLNFLYNHINPNEMEQYIRMYQAGDIPTNGE